jgi:hypothetical protein
MLRRKAPPVPEMPGRRCEMFLQGDSQRQAQVVCLSIRNTRPITKFRRAIEKNSQHRAFMRFLSSQVEPRFKRAIKTHIYAVCLPITRTHVIDARTNASAVSTVEYC